LYFTFPALMCFTSYRGFPELDADLFPSSVPQPALPARRPSVTLTSGLLAGQLCPYSPMTRRTKQEVKAMQKLSAKQADNPSLWARQVSATFCLNILVCFI